MPGDTETSGKAGKGAATDAGSGLEETSRAIVLNDQGGSQMDVSEDVTGTLRAQEHGHQPIVYGISAYESNAMKSGNPNSGIYEAETSRTLDLNGGSPACNQGGMAVVCLEGNGSRPSHKGDGYAESDTMYTLNSTEHHAVCIENHPADSRVKISEDGMVQTLSGRMGTGGGNVPMVMEQPVCMTTEITPKVDDKGVGFSLRSRDYKDPQAVCIGNGQVDQLKTSDKVGALNCMHDQQAVICKSIVRRLTPLECTRLQGFPDGWVDIGEWVDSKGKVRKESDAPKYKALGNSIALPFWRWLAERIREQYPGDDLTMASLFDGICGFPLVFSQVGIKPVWCSEIEDFPIAVAKKHFPDID